MRRITYLLDVASGSTFVLGVITAQHVAIFLGGLASIAALINHAQQIRDRYRKNKNNQDA